MQIFLFQIDVFEKNSFFNILKANNAFLIGLVEGSFKPRSAYKLQGSC